MNFNEMIERNKADITLCEKHLNSNTLLRNNYILGRDGLYLKLDIKKSVVVGHHTTSLPPKASWLTEEDAKCICGNFHNGNGAFKAIRIGDALRETIESLTNLNEFLTNLPEA